MPTTTTATRLWPVLLCVACGAPATTSQPAKIDSAPSATAAPAPSEADDSAARLLADLRAAGLIVRPQPAQPGAGEKDSCWLKGEEQRFTLDAQAERVTVFVYPSAAEAQKDAGQVQCSGDVVAGCILEWASYPHFFRRDNLIVFHLGSLEQAKRLSTILGAPFAGQQAPCYQKMLADNERARQRVAAGEVGAIAGVVKWANGRAVVGAQVMARTEGHQDSGVTGPRGQFELSRLPVGRYDVDVTRHSDVVWRGSVEVNKGQTARVTAQSSR